MQSISKVIVKAIVFDVDGRVLALKRSANDNWSPGEWESAGGKVDDDEDFVTACARELMEEAGITVDPRDLHIVYTQSFMSTLDNLNRVWLYFVCRVTNPKVVISEEHEDFKWVSLDEACEIYDPAQRDAIEYVRDNKLTPR